jgi:hypothetical protein
VFTRKSAGGVMRGSDTGEGEGDGEVREQIRKASSREGGKKTK